MNLIDIEDSSKCTNCYKCVQNCFTKAIKIDNENKDIIIDEDMCTGCGYCTKSCKSEVIVLSTDFDKVRDALKQKKDVYLILDTIYQSDFKDVTYNQMRDSFKRMGFKDVVENFTGFALHSYLCNEHFIKTGKPTLKSFCIPFNNYVSKFYSELIDYLAPIATPENISSRLTKEKHGDNIVTVYATTCFSSTPKTSSYDCDYIILTSELKKLLKMNNINPSRFHDNGAINTIYKYDGELSDERIETIKSCSDALKYLMENKDHSSLITPYWCDECFSSPVFTNDMTSYERKRIYQKYKKKGYNIIELNEETVKRFGDLKRFNAKHRANPVIEEKFSEDEITEALNSFGRYSTNDHFDCGACGYPTCRENAIAILKGKSVANQCIPYISQGYENNIKTLDKTYKELDDAFALTIPNSRLEIKLKNTKEYKDVYIKETGKIKIIDVVKDGGYRHVVNALKVAADLHSKGVMAVIGFDKDILVKTIIFHDIGKSQPALKVGDVVDPSVVFENGKMHAERSADLAIANYAHEGINKDIYNLIKYHHHNEKELPEVFPVHLLPMYRLFRIIDGISAGLTRRGNEITFDLVGSVLYIKEDSQNPNYRRFYSIDLYKPEYLKKEYDFSDDLDVILKTRKYK